MVVVNIVLKRNLVNFIDFELLFRGNFYNVVYCVIGGIMCFVDFVLVFEFFLYYGFVDKIWDDWQKKSDVYLNVFFFIINEVMLGIQVLFREVVNFLFQLGGVCGEYQ